MRLFETTPSYIILVTSEMRHVSSANWYIKLSASIDVWDNLHSYIDGLFRVHYNGNQNVRSIIVRW